jgi:hypothetical protein
MSSQKSGFTSSQFILVGVPCILYLPDHSRVPLKTYVSKLRWKVPLETTWKLMQNVVARVRQCIQVRENYGDLKGVFFET